MEIGNEPNALGYFWGNASEFQPIATAALQVQNSTKNNMICCGFATEMSGYNKKQGSSLGFVRFAQKHAGIPLSFHFYRHSMNDLNNNRSTYDNITQFYGKASLAQSSITEWGMFTYNSDRSTQEINSDLLMNELVQLMLFSFQNKIASIHFHCLTDNSHKQGHNCYFDRFGNPKRGYENLVFLLRTVEKGFTAEQSGGSTFVYSNDKSRYIVCACGDWDGRNKMDVQYHLPLNYSVIASSDFVYSNETISAGHWMVVQEEEA